eukprot:3890065-Rhodomonas_salina.1
MRAVLYQEEDWVGGVRRGPDGVVEAELRCHACELPYDRNVIEQVAHPPCFNALAYLPFVKP